RPTEAMRTIIWSLATQLFPSQHSPPAPFTQAEFEQLQSLFQSYGIFSQFIEKTLVRWRQLHFRPHKALPDVGIHRSEPHLQSASGDADGTLAPGSPTGSARSPPLAGSERTIRRRRAGEHAGVRDYIVPAFVTGACTCLVAASIIGLSPTFTRAAVVGATLSAVASNIATAIICKSL
ncbi:hypothetical protein BD779DRAFT_1578091, partial [Infundibulicybe gibba]